MPLNCFDAISGSPEPVAFLNIKRIAGGAEDDDGSERCFRPRLKAPDDIVAAISGQAKIQNDQIRPNGGLERGFRIRRHVESNAFLPWPKGPADSFDIFGVIFNEKDMVHG